ncbi:MAG: hypothetical protein ABII79_13475 [bacterium]
MSNNHTLDHKATVVGLLLVILAGTASAQPQRVAVCVNEAPLAWSGSILQDRLLGHLSRNQSGRFIPSGRILPDGPPFPADRYHLDSLVNWGLEAGVDHLLIVDVDNEQLRREKSFHLPLVFHKYETVGVIEGQLRLIDVAGGRLLVSEPFRVKEKGARIFQATMDDDINDPDLHLTASAKLRLFHSLEERLAAKITKRVEEFIHLR